MTRTDARQHAEMQAAGEARRAGNDRPVADGAIHGGPDTVGRAVIGDVDQLKAAYRQFCIEPLQVGPPQRAARTITVSRERFAFVASEQGFPTLTVAHIPDDRVGVGFVRDTPPGSRWCEHDLEPGAVVVWNPSAFHRATNRPGLDVMVTQLDVDLVEALGDRTGLRVPSLRPGEVRMLRPGTPGTAAVARAFSNYRAVASTGETPGPVYDEDLVLAASRLLAAEDEPHGDGAARRIDNRVVVQNSLDYADSIGRIPSIAELCAVAHVSERRLRQAFTSEFDTPPSRFFRVWALTEAHRRLVESRTTSVTSVALDLGFEHMGRFAGHYRAVYGEAPSATLRGE